AAEAASIDSSAHRAAQLYWRAQYRQPPAALSLPTDRPRPQVRGFAAGVVEHPVEARTLAALRRLATQHDCSPRAVLLAVQAAWLQRLCGCSDLVIAVAVSAHPSASRLRPEHRGPEHRGTEPAGSDRTRAAP